MRACVISVPSKRIYFTLRSGKIILKSLKTWEICHSHKLYARCRDRPKPKLVLLTTAKPARWGSQHIECLMA